MLTLSLLPRTVTTLFLLLQEQSTMSPNQYTQPRTQTGRLFSPMGRQLRRTRSRTMCLSGRPGVSGAVESHHMSLSGLFWGVTGFLVARPEIWPRVDYVWVLSHDQIMSHHLSYMSKKILKENNPGLSALGFRWFDLRTRGFSDILLKVSCEDVENFN